MARGGGRHRLVSQTGGDLRSCARPLWPLVSRCALQHMLQFDRPACCQRPRRAGSNPLRQCRHRTEADDHLCGAFARSAGLRDHARRLRGRTRRSRASLYADGAGSGDRACWLARASARFTRWCSAALRRRNSRRASTTPRRRSILSACCGIEPGRIVAYKPLLDEAIDAQPAQARRLRHPAASAG